MLFLKVCGIVWKSKQLASVVCWGVTAQQGTQIMRRSKAHMCMYACLGDYFFFLSVLGVTGERAKASAKANSTPASRNYKVYTCVKNVQEYA